MKKLSPRQERVLRYRSVRAQRHSRNRKPRTAAAFPPAPRSRRDFHVVVPPMLLDFEQNYERTIAFFELLRQFLLSKRRRVFINMTSCKEISAPAALVLAAEIQRATSLYPQCVSGCDPMALGPFLLLRDLGFHELLGFRARRVPPRDDNIEIVHMVSGAAGNTSVFPSLIELVLGKGARLTGNPARNRLTAGLQEAMNNAVTHAYEDLGSIRYPVAKELRWWMAGFRDAKNKSIGFMFYDQGMTIPVHLPKKWREALSEFLSRMGSIVGLTDGSIDGEIIKKATEVGRTSADGGGHGWGFSDMKRLIGDVQPEGSSPSGSLHIMSRRGSYIYSREDGEVWGQLRSPFWGTLLVWHLAGSDLIEWTDDGRQAA